MKKLILLAATTFFVFIGTGLSNGGPGYPQDQTEFFDSTRLPNGG